MTVEAETRNIPHFIGWRAVTATASRTSDVFDPNCGQVQARVGLGTAACLVLAERVKLETGNLGRAARSNMSAGIDDLHAGDPLDTAERLE